MNTQIHTKEITLTDHTRTHIEAAFEQFGKYSLDITTINAHLAREKKGISVEFELHIAHHQPVIINHADNDMDAAIDLAVERTCKALRRMHDKDISHRGGSIKDLETADDE